MGNIRIYDSQRAGGGTLQSRADAEDFGAAIGRGARAIGQGLARMGDRQDRELEQAEVSDATTSGYADNLALEQIYAEDAANAVPGDRQAGDRVLQKTRDYFAAKEDKYTTPRARDYARQLAEKSTNQFGVRGLALQAQLNGQKYKNDALLTSDSINQTVAANPAAYADARDRLRFEAEQGIGFWEFGKPGERPALTEQMVESAAWNAAMGALGDPGLGANFVLSKLAPDALKGEDWKGNMVKEPTGVPYLDDLDFEKKKQLVTAAHANRQQSQRLAAGNLKVELENQTAEAKLYGTVKNPLTRPQFEVYGKDADAEWEVYQGKLKAYGLVFEYIKLDPEEANRRIEAMKPVQGKVTDANARQYNLVRTAYAEQQKALSADQIGVAQARELPGMNAITPADDSQTHFGKLSGRLATARDLAGKTGKFRPYSEAEAQATRAKLDGMGDGELRQWFLGAKQIIKNPEEYRAYAQQLYPDNSAMRAGSVLIGKNGMGAMDNGVVYDASVVSARVISGARYLDKKSAEGKDLRDSGLPDESKMEKKFREIVGDAVPPQYHREAYNIAKAYYIGEGLATRSGLHGEMDEALMKRSVNLALGATVANPDGSKVFAPWGMDATRFRNEAKARFELVRKQHNLPGSFETQTLVPFPGREGVYGIKAGNSILPYQLDLNTPIGAGSSGVSGGW